MPRANPDVNYEISIHALLAESDRSLLLPVRGSRISIHALLAESDIDAAVEVAHIRNFYPRSPCGERPHSTKKQVEYWIISIHALLAESDLPQSAKVGVGVSFLSTLSLRRATVFILYPDSAPTFLSTLSLRRATFLPLHTRQRTQISIHALLAESDTRRLT